MQDIDTSRAAVERVLDEELIAELREALVPYDPDVDAQEYWHGLCGSAADRIEALLARAEAAEARADAMRQAVQHANDHADAAIADMEAMTRERDAERETVARLEAALRKAEQDFYEAANRFQDEDYEGPHEKFTVNVVCHIKPYFDMHMKHLRDSAEAARAALKGADHE